MYQTADASMLIDTCFYNPSQPAVSLSDMKGSAPTLKSGSHLAPSTFLSKANCPKSKADEFMEGLKSTEIGNLFRTF